MVLVRRDGYPLEEHMAAVDAEKQSGADWWDRQAAIEAAPAAGEATPAAA